MSLTPEQLQEWFAAGPVLLLCDGDHPGHRGLPAQASGKVVVAQLAGPIDLQRLMLTTPDLSVRYGTDNGDYDAVLDRAGIFGLAGRQGDSTQVVLRQAPPALLGPMPPVALQQILSTMGLTPPDASGAEEAQPAPELLLLAPPQLMTPRQAVQWAQTHGVGLILVDGLAPAVLVPAGLQTQPVVAVPVGMPWALSEIELDDEGFSASIPDGRGEQGPLRAPWTAVISVNSLGGAIHGSWNWPDHPSSGLRLAMAAQAQAADPSEREHQGQWVLQFDQPIGPAQPWGVPMLHVEYRLARHPLN